MKKLNVIEKMEINHLANVFYKMQGYNVEEGYDFEKAHHPQEVMVWNQALLSYNFWFERLGKRFGK